MSLEQYVLLTRYQMNATLESQKKPKEEDAHDCNEVLSEKYTRLFTDLKQIVMCKYYTVCAPQWERDMCAGKQGQNICKFSKPDLSAMPQQYVKATEVPRVVEVTEAENIEMDDVSSSASSAIVS